ncbi:nuclease-related domain-containing protein [Janibacter cremeus]|uniref:nuclease-related domain-containing protein n=1 Tax=Janibacter cremeus TaxID=1285192 RepID=UPI0023F9AC79|nr:nuclease-related domain-containing protein [Janibacter cremeus]WEV77126.1 nuclease-related domain-containing protein [Janibacter cremeus]
MSGNVADESEPLAVKRMRLRYAGTCSRCGTELPAKADAVYERATKTVRCVDCPVTIDPPDPNTEAVTAANPSIPTEQPGAGVAGSSARREYERRRVKDEEQIRRKWGRLGGIAVALADERQETKAWASGAVGEELLGHRLDSLARDRVAVMHDRRIPRTRANIDHIAVTSAGVWVIDAKRYKGARPELRVEGGILRPRVEKLLIGRRDRTPLVDGVLKQVGLVQDLLGEGVPVTGALCFIEADWPLIGGSFSTRGVHVLWPKRLAHRLTEQEGVLDVAAVRDLVAGHFPPA